MGAKFRFMGAEEATVETRQGTFVAQPQTVYEVSGPAVSDLRRREDFVREVAEAQAEEPTWQSPS